MSDFGIKIVKPGFDAKTADLKDQVLNSEHNSLKIWMAGHVDISKGAEPGEFSTNVAHNLGYAPFYLVYFKLVHATKLWFQDSLDMSGGFISGLAKTDNTNLILTIRDNEGLGAFTATAYYQILIDKAYE